VVQQREEFRSGEPVGVEHVDMAGDGLQPVFPAAIFGESDDNRRAIQVRDGRKNLLPVCGGAKDGGKALMLQPLDGGCEIAFVFEFPLRTGEEVLKRGLNGRWSDHERLRPSTYIR
jgi:hypothetical protein